MSITSGAALLLGFLLFNHPQQLNVIANKWLGIFIVTLGLAMLEIFLVSQNFQYVHPNYFELIGIGRFVTAPALYLAILSFTSLDKTFRPQYLWHFVPFVLVLLLRIPFLMTGHNINFSEPIRTIILCILQSILPLQAIVYWIFSFKKLQQHQVNINQFSASNEKIDLLWLKSFLLILLVVLVVWFNLIFFNIPFLRHFTPLFYLISVFFLAYFSLKQKEVFEFDATEIGNLSEIIHPKNPVAKQKRLNESQMAMLNEKLTELMTVDQLFLDNALSLPVLARSLGATSNETSYLINEIYQDNFYNFINQYRVEEAKKLLLSDEFQKRNIIGIAYQSGFNSKTAFHLAFKKYTGQSPTDFIKQNGITVS